MSQERKKIIELRRLCPIVKGCPKGCADCCGIVPFSFWEWNHLADKRHIDPEDHLKCPYSNKRGRCDIYEDRPIICRLYGSNATPIENQCKNNPLLHDNYMLPGAVRGSTYSIHLADKIMTEYRAILEKTGVHGFSLESIEFERIMARFPA